MRQTRGGVAGVALLVVGAMLFGVGCRNVNLLGKSEEIRLGRQASAEIEKVYEISTNPADVALVEGIGQSLVAANEITGWPFTFKVIEDREVNAVSLPGGPVYLFRGLVDLTEGNRDQIAAVIAHEIAHIEKRHVAKMYSSGVLADLAILLGTGGAVRTAADIVRVFVSMRFSRDDEYEADRLAIRYTYRAGFDPNGLVRFFEKLKRLERQGSGDIISNNLRTHPLTDARIKAAKKEIDKIVQQVNAEEEAAYIQAVAGGK